ncbi:hypothetical protein FcAc13_11820 [Frischella sp. Ac13]|uniref:Tox-REase-3 domain-containing protein n=2 Tax=Frischella japonica TaxID=2741544 RepID=A0ABR7R0M0_9GAMM|nr:hypothetical protein [Frischella japonica]
MWSNEVTATHGGELIEWSGLLAKGYGEIAYTLIDIGLISKASSVVKMATQTENVIKLNTTTAVKVGQTIKPTEVTISIDKISLNQKNVIELKEFNVGKEATDLTSKYSGNLVKVNKPDPAADALAQRIGGESRVRFTNDIREFDVISDLYVAQTKPALKQLNAAVRNQMKATFEAAKETNRSVYYHFEGQPDQSIINKLNEYSKRYGVKVVIDTKPLNLTK